MIRYISKSIIFLILTNIGLSITTIASADGDFQLVPMHYGFLNGTTRDKDANQEGNIDYPLTKNASKGSKQIKSAKASQLNPQELIVYRTTSGKYYVGQVVSVTGNTIKLTEPLKGAVKKGKNAWNFYVNDNHPNTFGYRALGDFALANLDTAGFAGKYHAFAGDSWFDNDYNIPHLSTKLNASKVVNKAVGGRTTVDVLKEFDKDFPPGAATQPDYIWVILGTNDYFLPVSRTDYISNIQQIINKINALGAQAILYTPSVGITLPKDYDPTFYYRLSNDYADDMLALTHTSSADTLKANDDVATVEKGKSVLIDVISNDTGKGRFVYAVDETWTGSISIENGKIKYTSDGSYIGNLEVYYGLSDSTNSEYSWAKITISITDNSSVLLQANNDTATVESGGNVIIDVLANDTGKNISIVAVDDAWTGTISINNGKLKYVSDGSYVGDLSVWYGIADATGESWGKVTITVTSSGPVSALKANNDTATVALGQTVLIDVLANDTGNGRAIYEVDEVWTGTISINNGKLKYVSDGSYTGSLTVWYGINTGPGTDDSWAKIDITITP